MAGPIGLNYDQGYMASIDAMMATSTNTIKANFPKHNTEVSVPTDSGNVDPNKASNYIDESAARRAETENYANSTISEDGTDIEALSNDKKIIGKANLIRNCFHDFVWDDSNTIKATLNSLNPNELAAVELAYDKLKSEEKGEQRTGALRADIYSHMRSYSGRNILTGASIVGLPLLGVNIYKNNADYTADAALAKLNEGARVCPKVGAIAINSAIEGLGTDEKTLHAVIDGTPKNPTKPETMSQIYNEYLSMFGTDMGTDIKDDFLIDTQEGLRLIQKCYGDQKKDEKKFDVHS